MHASALKEELVARKCETEIVTLPFKWYPPERLLDCMLMARLMDIEEVNGMRIDRVIALKFPAYFAAHSKKVCWILHQHRQAYDLYGSGLSDLWQSAQGQAVAAEIKRWDDYFLPQSTAIYANSRTVAERLLRFNKIEATPLYHPPFNHAKLRTGRWDSYVLYPGRFDAMKRQHLIVQALERTPERVHLVLCGNSDSGYGVQLRDKIAKSPLRSRIKVLGYVSESEKLDLYANCLAVYNGVVDEDYGYVTLEAFCAGKPVITHTDSGGPLEFVVDGRNGYITEPEVDELARCITSLAENPAHARELGANARQTMRDKNISWDYVIEKLLDG